MKVEASEMITVFIDSTLDVACIEFEPGTAGYAVELDENRIVDYSLNPGRPIGVCFHNISEGVLLDGLPKPDTIKKILSSFDIKAIENIG